MWGLRSPDALHRAFVFEALHWDHSPWQIPPDLSWQIHPVYAIEGA